MKRIKINILHDNNVSAQGCILTRGIPFANGTLKHGEPIRVVDEDGSELESQSTCLATWAKDREYVKWLLVDFRVDLHPAQNRTVFLEWGDVTPKAIENPVAVNDLIVNNGVIKAKFRGDTDFMPWLKVKTHEGWRDIFRGKPGIQLCFKDNNGTEYTSGVRASSVKIEETGDLRTVVRVDGEHATTDGRALCPFTLRFHFYANSGEIKLLHNFVFNGDPELLKVADMSVKIGLDLDGITLSEFGGGNSCRFFQEAVFLQETDEKYRFLVDGKNPRTGDRTHGYVNITGGASSFGAVIKNMWQEYAKAFKVTPEGAEIKIWPEECGKLLDFDIPNKIYPPDIKTHWAELGKILDDRDEGAFVQYLKKYPQEPLCLKRWRWTSKEELLWTFDILERHASDRFVSFNDLHADGNGHGASKTTEILLKVGEGPLHCMDDRASLLQDPPVPITDGLYTASTKAIRSTGTSAFEDKTDDVKKIEKELYEYFYRLVIEPRVKLQNYGILVHGDLMCCHSQIPADTWLQFKDDQDYDIKEIMRFCSKCYNNEANDQLYSMWGFALHFGEKEQYLNSELFGNNLADLGIIHAGKDQGLVHYHGDHKFSAHGAICHTTMPGLRLQYYLTGNRRLFDVIEENKDHIMGRVNRAGLIAMKGGLIRQLTTPLSNLFSYYEMTWDEITGEVARRTFKWLCLSIHKNCMIPITIHNGGRYGDDAWISNAYEDAPHFFQPGGLVPELGRDAVTLFGDREPVFRNFLIGLVEEFMKVRTKSFSTFSFEVGENRVKMPSPGGSGEQLFAYAYEITEDIRYAAYSLLILRKLFRPFPEHFQFFLISFGGWVPKLIHAVNCASEKYGKDKLLKTLEDLVEEINHQGRDQVTDTIDRDAQRLRHLGRITGYDE